MHVGDLLTRRHFLSVMGAASFAPADPPLTLGFSTYGMPNLDTAKALGLLARIGFDSVELALLPGRDTAPERLTPASRRELRKRLNDSGLRLTALMENLAPSPQARAHAAALERLERAADLARDLAPGRPPLIETVLGGGTWEKARNLFRDRLGDWVRVTAARKVVLAIKPHRFGAMSLPGQAVWLIRQLRETPWLRLVFDHSHYELRGLNLARLVEEAAPFAAFVAVKDVVMEKGRAVFRLPGTAGETDYPDLFRRLHRAGYRGDVNCEVSGMVFAQKGYDAEAAARTCYARMSAALAKAGLRKS